MKPVKVLITAIALGVAAAAPLQAQDKKGNSPEAYVERVEQAVGSLTSDQKTKIKDIVAKTQEEMRAIPKEERKEKGAPLQKKQRDQIRALLNAEQQKKFDAMGQGGSGGGKKKNQ
jgi:hypothetical protein